MVESVGMVRDSEMDGVLPSSFFSFLFLLFQLVSENEYIMVK